MKSVIRILTVGILAAISYGCLPPPEDKSEDKGNAVEQEDGSASHDENKIPDEDANKQAGTVEANTPADGPSDEDRPSKEEIVEKETIKAEVGVSGKGQGYGGDPITEPVSQYFRAQERIKFLTVNHSLKLYTATQGKGPKSHDEFMKGVIKANQIKLPKLPEGHEYIFDAEQQQLMVRRPK